MIPTSFPQQNKELGKPDNMTDAQCSSLDVHVRLDEDGWPELISCWMPTDEERKLIAEGKPVWLTVVGVNHPPIKLSAINPFPTPQVKA